MSVALGFVKRRSLSRTTFLNYSANLSSGSDFPGSLGESALVVFLSSFFRPEILLAYAFKISFVRLFYCEEFSRRPFHGG